MAQEQERESPVEEWERKENEKLEANKERYERLGHEVEVESTVDANTERQIRLGHIEEKPKSKSKPKAKAKEAKEESKESEA